VRSFCCRQQKKEVGRLACACLTGFGAPQPKSRNSESSILIDLYEAAEYNGPVLHYYVVVVKDVVANHRHPNDFDIEKVEFIVNIFISTAIISCGSADR